MSNFYHLQIEYKNFWRQFEDLVGWLVGLIRYIPVNSFGLVMPGPSVHLTTLFSWASLTKQLTSTLCVTDKLPWFSGREENGRRNYFLINLHESMEPGWAPGSAVRHVVWGFDLDLNWISQEALVSYQPLLRFLRQKQFTETKKTI